MHYYSFDVITNSYDIQVRSLPMATLLLDSLPSLRKVIEVKNTIRHQTLETRDFSLSSADPLNRDNLCYGVGLCYAINFS